MSAYHDVLQQVKSYEKEKNNYIHLEYELLEYIFSLKLSSSSKLLLFKLITKKSFINEHLYIATTLNILSIEINQSRGSVYNALQPLKDEFIKIYSGTENKEQLVKLREKIFKKKQQKVKSKNEMNIYSLQPLYEKFFKYGLK